MIPRSAFLILAVVLLSGACSGGPEPAGSPSGAVTSAAAGSPCTEPRVLDAESAEVEGLEQIRLGGAAWSVKFGFDAAWIQVDEPVDQLVKVDQASGEVSLAIDGGRGVAIASDAVWVANGVDLVKIDPVTCETLLTVPARASYVAVGLGSVWAPSADQLLRFDESTGAPLATIDAGFGLTDLHVDDDAVWVTAKDSGTVLRIDPGTNAVVAEIHTGGGAHDLDIDEHGVWVANYRANSVSLIDPATNTVATTIEGLGSGVGIALGQGAVWVSTQYGGITKIDPETYATTSVVQLPEWNYGLALAQDELWVSSTSGWVYRLPLPAP